MKKLLKTGNMFFSTEHFRKKSAFTAKLTSAFLVFILCAFNLSAQDHQVTGTVVDDVDEEPLPGVTVVVEGTTIGTVTDADGLYTLTVPSPDDVLAFSFVGFERQSIPIEGREVIDVAMVPEYRVIDEIVVVGYGVRMREELTGSVSTMSGEQMELATAPSVLGRIQGQVSGTHVTTSNTPGGGAEIRVRGLGTINDNEPLYIIDGVPTSPGNNLSAGDIESISILKDAASTAIYGTRGANGVVIITTKRGELDQMPTVNFNVRSGITQAVNQYDLLNTAEYGELVFLEARNRGRTPGVDWEHEQYGDGTEPRIPNYILPAGAMSVDYDRYSYPDFVIFPASVPGTNWYDEMYRNGLIQEYDLSVTGGGENVTYAFSASYLDEEGMLHHTGFDRFTFRSNADARVTDWFQAGQSLQVVRTSQYGNLSDNHEATVISQGYRPQPIIPVYDIMGNFAGSRAPTMGNAANPIAMLERDRNDGGNYFRVLGNLFGEADLYEGMTFRSTLGYNYGQWNGQWAAISNPEHSEPSWLDHFNRNNNYSFQWNWSNTLNYATTIAEDHRLDVILGTEAIENNYEWMNAGRSNYFAIDPLYMQLSSGEENMSNSGSGSEWSLFSLFGRVNYDVGAKYLFEATMRRDGSSRFGPEHRYATFPAASFAWAISAEDFMAGTRDWLDFLKLRIGWGLAGNDRIGNYNVFTTYATHIMHSAYAIDGSNTSTRMGFQPSDLGNPDVTWETTETTNLGLDVVLLDNRFSLTVDTWRRYTSDMLYQLSVPQVAGVATPPFVNIGEMENRGIDIELAYMDTALGGRFRYSVSGNISRYVNEVVRLSPDIDEYIVMGHLRQYPYQRTEAGRAFPEFYGYIVDGFFMSEEEAEAHPPFGDYNAQGRFRYRNLDGEEIDADDQTYIGNPHPDFTAGLNIDLGFGNFDLSAFFYGSYGNDIINYVTRWIDQGMFHGGRSKRALYESWGSPYLESNEDATLPIADQAEGSHLPSTHYIEDGSFLRLKNLRLGYRFPEQLTTRIGIQNLRIYGQATNLFTITNYSGLDPELHGSGPGMGLDQGAWPTPRQIMFGVNIGI